ncbi:hypothetical protein EMIT0P228_140094 [Pseudomonas brassicacearum]
MGRLDSCGRGHREKGERGAPRTLADIRIALIVHQGLGVAKGRNVDCVNCWACVWVYAYLAPLNQASSMYKHRTIRRENT